MDQVNLSAEIQRLLADPPLGGLSDLARAVGISAASVSAWRTGRAVPTPARWAAIEKFLSIPNDYLSSVAEGWVADPPIPAVWPSVHPADRRGSITPPADAPTDGPRAQDELLRRLDHLQDELTRLSRVVAKQGVQLKQLTSPARRASD